MIYVSGTKDTALLYRTSVAEQLVGYMNVDWAENVGDHRSTSSFAFSLGSAVIARSSKKQSAVAMSSTEAEYKGEAITTCEAILLKRLLKNQRVEVCKNSVRKLDRKQKTKHRNWFNGELRTQDTQYAGETERELTQKTKFE